MSEFSLYFEHSTVYSNKNPLPIQDVIESLEGMRRLSRTLLPQTLSKLSRSKIIGVEVLVDGFEEGSFKENFVLRLIFSSERGMKRFEKAFRKGDIAGMCEELPFGDKPVKQAVIISVVIAALLGYGVYEYAKMSGNASAQPLIQANNNTVVMIGAEAYGMTAEDFSQIIQAVAESKKKQLISDASKILAPAHREPGATVTMGSKATLNDTTVLAIPPDISYDEYEQEQDYENVVVDIRQMNRDSAASGWRGRIEGMFDDRVKLTLGDEVSIEDLAGKLNVRANVVVTSRMSPSKKTMVPREILIVSVLQDDSN